MAQAQRIEQRKRWSVALTSILGSLVYVGIKLNNFFYKTDHLPGYSSIFNKSHELDENVPKSNFELFKYEYDH